MINAPETELLSTLLAAPPLDNQAIEETQEVLADILPPAIARTVQQPKAVTIQKVRPTPILRLTSLPWSRKPSRKTPRKKSSVLLEHNQTAHEQRLAKANLLFDYLGQRMDFNDETPTLPSVADTQQIIPRHQTIESQAVYALADHLHPTPLMPEAAGQKELNPNDLITALPGDPDYQRNWIRVMTELIPQLEDQGWVIEMADDFPFQFEVVPDDHWHAELEESENQWFSLKLGITLDGKQLDLLPLLARQIHQLPPADELKKLDKEAMVPVALPGGKFINMPAGRLHLILSTLLELFGDRPQDDYRLENYHAQLWEELYAKLDLPWAGGEKLLALSRKLKSFKRLKKVKPARTLQAELRPYQQHGLSWLQFLREYGLNGILADDMGLGKTLQTLAHLQLEKQRLGKARTPSLVVCPTSLIHNWRNEATRFTPDLNIHIHHGAQRDSADIDQADLVLTSYGIVQRDFDTLSQHHFHCMVLDEAQAIKNPQAKSAKALRCLKAEHKLCLTGTPMENHLGELWSLFDFLMPGFLGAHDQFTRYYRTPIEKHGNNEASKRLQKRVAPFMLRRGKDLVAKELPPKTEIVRTTELTGKQRDLYETVRASMEARVRSEVEKKGLARSQIFILDALLKMRQTCCDPTLVKLEQAATVKESAKLDLLMSLVEPMIEEGRHILIFSQFTTMLTLIEQRLKQVGIEWVKLTGQTRDRNKPINRFQNDEVPVFLISLKAGGTGLNLTAADTVIHYDPWWNPAVEDQASDRAHRIGQDKPVFVYKLVTEGTVEEKIQELKEKKRAIASAV
ncbi:MAG: DEAD/DEAH box helicase, partial [Endozoicomonas sp.]